MPSEKEIVVKLLHVFEQVYAERGVYRALAQQLPDWKHEFEILMADDEYHRGVAETFSGLSNALASRQRLEEIFQSMSADQLN